MANELPGYDVEIYISRLASTPTAVSGGSATLVSGKTYRVASTNCIWDPDTAVVVYDNGSPVASGDIATLDYLHGSVTFASGYTVTGPVTIDYSYFTRTQIAYAKAGSFRCERDLLDTSRFDTAHRKRVAGLKTASGTISYIGFIGDSVTSNVNTEFEAGTEYVIEFWWRVTGSYATIEPYPRKARCFIESLAPQADVEGLVEDTISWQSTNYKATTGYDVNFSLGRIIP